MTPAEKLAASKPPRRTKPAKPRYGRAYPWDCRCRQARQSHRLSLRDVATAVKLSIAGLCEIERGSDPQLTTARRLAAFYGRTVEELWTLKE